MSDKVTHLSVSVNGEWGEFFVAEREPFVHSDGRVRHSATWVCHSSYGTFGHHWYDMGQPFAEFIADINPNYLLSKIGRRVTDEAKVYKEVRRLIREARKSKEITTEQAREAMDAVQEIEDDCPSPEAACHLLHASPEVNCFHIEWCDMSTQDYDTSSKMFVKKIWTEFLREFRASSVEAVR